MKKIITAATLLLALLLIFAGCSNEAPEASPDTSASAEASPTITATPDPAKAIKAGGSDFVGALISEIAQTYTDANAGVTVDVSDSNSNLGIAALAKGDIQIALSSRALKDAEKTVFSGVREAALCMDGIAVIVNADCPVSSLTKQQIKDIFTGEISDWSEIGGETGNIMAYTLSSGSEIRKAFNSYFLGLDENGDQADTNDYLTSALDSGEEVIAEVLDDKTAIGYVPMSELVAGTVKALSIDGAAATAVNLGSGSYPYALNYILVTINPSAETQAFIDYCTGAEAAALIKEKGLIVK